jgi:predicted nucleic acid-binding Zn ribbon protein
MGAKSQMNLLGKYASYQDLSRLEYGRLLWANPAARARLLRHWTSPRHPHHARFATHRGLVEKVLSTSADDVALDAALRERGQSLRTAVREIPPVFGTI